MMNLYHILASIKLLLGVIFVLIVYIKIDPRQDPAVAILFGAIAFLLFVWGFSYWLYYIVYMSISDKKLYIISSQSYKLSVIIAIYMTTNFILIMTQWRDIWIGLILLILCILLQILFFDILNIKTNTGTPQTPTE